MNKLILLFLLAFSTGHSMAQKQYFMYLQAENGQPFHVRINEKTHQSAQAGYLILSSLPDSTIDLRIGFLYERAPEQVYTIHMNRRDRGFMIRHFGEKGWGLSDLQDQSIIYSTGGNKTASSGKAAVMSTSKFAELLSRASDDPSLREIVLRGSSDELVNKENKEIKEEKEDKRVKTNEPKTDVPRTESVNTDISKPEAPKTAIVKTDVAKTDEPKTEMPKTEVAKNEAVKTDVTKTEASKTGMVKTDAPKTEAPKTEKPKTEVAKTDVASTEVSKTDMVKNEEAKMEKVGKPVANGEDQPKASRPESITEKVNEKPVKKEEPYQRSVVTKKSEQSTTQGFGVTYVDSYADGKKDTVSIVIPELPKPAVVVKEEPKEEKKFLDISSEKKTPDTAVASGITNKCNYVANNNDFFKLRKDMAAAEGDEAMLTLARKYFKLKCYTVSQVKSLGALFLEDEGKYQFYDIVYRHTTDPENFASLETELKDTYYINRFKAMLRN